MKHCPVCDAKYDEEIIRFCTKDGSPLIDEGQPNFVQMPSESLEEPEDDPGEVTIIRRKPAASTPDSDEAGTPSERIVIPTSSEPASQTVRPRPTQAYYAPPPPANTTKTVVLTIIGTLAILGFGAGLFWFLQKESTANKNGNINANSNQNTNLNTNIKFDSNFNFNANGNFATPNLNVNLKTPTPTPKPSPSASPSPSSSPTPRPSPSIRPSPSPTPRMGPRPPTPNVNH